MTDMPLAVKSQSAVSDSPDGQASHTANISYVITVRGEILTMNIHTRLVLALAIKLGLTYSKVDFSCLTTVLNRRMCICVRLI
ncbi:unnamed protein product [Dicrocoelium dendriticum]|nr:unnamed protein product [Dicrocoelium dendriticum]